MEVNENLVNEVYALIQERLSPYFGKSEHELCEEFGLPFDSNAKNRYERYLSKMVGISGRLSDASFIKGTGVSVKTIRVSQNGTIKESMSFPYFEYYDIYLQDWENSQLRKMFAELRYIFVIFKEKKGEMFFEKIKLWRMTKKELETIRPVFESLKKSISTGNIIDKLVRTPQGKLIRKTTFPSSKSNPIVHVRPHARDANDTCPLPVREKTTGEDAYTKHCFWLNSSYLEKVVAED